MFNTNIITCIRKVGIAVKKLHFIGVDGWSRPVYKDETGKLWKDVNLGDGIPSLHSSADNEFDGEPDMPLEGDFEIISDADAGHSNDEAK